MKKHIVLVNTGRVVNAKGGTEKVFCDMANALFSLGYDVTAVCLDKNQGIPGFPLMRGIRFINGYRGGAPFFSKGVFKNFRSLSLDRDVRHERRLKIESEWKIENLTEIIDRLPNIDLIIAFQPLTTYLLSRVENLQEPIVTMLHGAPCGFKNIAAIASVKNAVASCALLTVLISGFKTVVQEMFPRVPVKVMPNAIPNYRNAAMLVERKIIYVARLARDKRFELLIEAFS